MIEQIGLDNATFSIEFFCDPDTGEINVLEINPRHSQAHAELFEHVDGFPNHHYHDQAALGEDPGRPNGEGRYRISARWYLRRFADGRAARGPSADEIAEVEREHRRRARRAHGARTARGCPSCPARTATATSWRRSW